MLFFENIDISFRPELDKIGIMFKKGNTGGSNFRIEFAQNVLTICCLVKPLNTRNVLLVNAKLMVK